MKCKNCGAEISSSKTVCHYCNSEIINEVSQIFKDRVFFSELKNDFNICGLNEEKYKVIKKVNNGSVIGVERWSNIGGHVSYKTFSHNNADEIINDAIINNIPIIEKDVSILSNGYSKIDKPTSFMDNTQTKNLHTDNIFASQQKTPTYANRSKMRYILLLIVPCLFLFFGCSNLISNIVYLANYPINPPHAFSLNFNIAPLIVTFIFIKFLKPYKKTALVFKIITIVLLLLSAITLVIELFFIYQQRLVI